MRWSLMTVSSGDEPRWRTLIFAVLRMCPGWRAIRRLQLNSDKTELIWFSTRAVRPFPAQWPQYPCRLYRVAVPVDNIRIMGVQLDINLQIWIIVSLGTQNFRFLSWHSEEPQSESEFLFLVKFQMSPKRKSLALRVTSINLVSLERGSIVEYVFPCF